MAKKTISGARAKRGQKSNGCNPRHNNRDYLPSNADPNRQHLNEFFVESTQAITIEQIYEKLFQESYEEWLTKERAKGRQIDAPDKYIDKLRNSPDKKNKKREQYEIIWQIGDKKNTGWNSNRTDFSAARILLHDFAKHLQTLPEIEFATPEKINDPKWQPKSDYCLVVTNLALHGDENTPQLHMDFVPYCRGAKRGQKIQNAYAAAFEGMGYAVKTKELIDEEGHPVYKQDKNGNIIYKKNKDGSIMCNDFGEPIPEPVLKKESFGSIDWIEKQKQWISERMKERHGWEREYKGKNKFGDVTISEFIAEDNKRIIEEQEQHLQKTKEHLSFAVQRYHEIQSVNDKNLRIINKNRDLIAEQEQMLSDLKERVDTLQTIEEYTQEADRLEAKVSSVTNNLLNRLSKAVRPFKRKEAELFIDGIKNALEDVFKPMRGSLKRLTTFESDIEMREEERRSPALTEKIQVAERQAGFYVDDSSFRRKRKNGYDGQSSDDR